MKLSPSKPRPQRKSGAFNASKSKQRIAENTARSIEELMKTLIKTLMCLWRTLWDLVC